MHNNIILYIVILASFTWLYVGLFDSCQHIAIRILMVVVGSLALFVMPSASLTPEYGETLFPSCLLELTPINNGNTLIKFTNLPSKVKLVYWENDSLTCANGGVAMSNDKGDAIVSLNCPQKANLDRFGNDKKLPNVIYYRYEMPGGKFSSIESYELKCE